jgi:hypothetical protein
MSEYVCIKCGRIFKKSSHLKNHHNKKIPCIQEILIKDVGLLNTPKIPNIVNNNLQNILENKEIKCDKCHKTFKKKYNLERHQNGRCKVLKEENKSKKDKDLETKNNMTNIDELDINDQTKIILTVLLNQNKKSLEEMNKQIDILTEKNKNITQEFNQIKTKIKFDEEKQNNDSKIVNDKLISIIINKDKKIEELKNDKFDNIISNKYDNIENDFETNIENPINLTLNNHIIMSRENDKYINATQLCKAGNKKFNDWFRLDNTKELISILANDAGIPASQLIDSKKGKSSEFEQGTFIHPDLAIQLAQWINPHFALQVSSWIRILFTKGQVNIKLLKEQENKINRSTKKIKILEDMVLKKQKRTEYPELNVIYLLTTEDHKKRRIYILGKAKNLTTRLGTYNKTCVHEVIYYKECKTEKHMDLSEEIILLMLEEYREVANRDRFVLPVGEDIKFFTNIIDKYC